MGISALQLCSRFALSPNQLGYCGRDSAPAKLEKCITLKRYSVLEHCNVGKELSEEIVKFPVLHPYLQTIGEIAHLDKFSYKVVEAYWLGNDLLKRFKLEHYDLLLKNFSKQGVPNWLIEELKKKRPKAFIPIHLFNILHVGVGRATGAVPFNLDSINNCMVRWGEIKKIDVRNKKARIKLQNLKQEKSQTKYQLTTDTATIPYVPEFVPNMEIGDIVAIHWNYVAKVLAEKEVKGLEFWTRKLIESL